MDQGTVEIVILASIVLNMLLLVVFLWQRKYLSRVFKKAFLKINAREVRVFHKNRTSTTYYVTDVKGFSWKKNFFSNFFKNIPNTLDHNILPDTPYCRDTLDGTAQYEFHEDSNQCTDPFERQPDLYMKEADSNDAMNDWHGGELWSRMGGKSPFNMILLICVLAGVAVGVMNLMTVNGLSENFTKFADQAKPLLDTVAAMIKAQAAAPANGVVGIVK